MKWTWLSWGCLAVLIFLCGSASQAQQNTADIVGTVTDASGAIIPGATVTAVNTGTNISHTATSSSSGDYIFGGLQVGSYSVKVEAKGFKAFVSDVSISAGDRARVDAKMEVGDVTQTVEVSGTAAPALQTDSSTVGTLVTQQAVQDVPLNGRNFVKLVQLSAGVTQGTPGQINSGTRPDDRRQTSDFSANGQAELMNNNMIDGMDNNERIIGVIGVRPSVDAIQEVNVETNLYTAEVGRTGGGVVNLVTKSGTNSLHGTAYEFFRNKVLNANPTYQFPTANGGLNPAKPGANPPFRQNQYGGSIGGPIKKDKTFFFGDYEGFKKAYGLVISGLTVPTLCERGSKLAGLQGYTGGAITCPDGTSPTLPGDFSDVAAVSAAGGGPVCPQGTAGCAVVINPANFSTLGLEYFSMFPLPTSAATTGNFSSAPTDTQSSKTLDIKIDQHISDKDSFFARYSFNDVTTITPDAFPAVTIDPASGYPASSGVKVAPGAVPFGAANNFAGPSYERQQGLALSYAHIFSSNLVLNLRAGYLRSAIRSLPLGATPNVATALGFPCNSISCVNIPTAGFLPSVTFASVQSGSGTSTVPSYTGFTDTFFVPLLQFDNTFQYNGSLSWNKGSHAVKIGATLIRRQATIGQSQSPDGRFNFTGIYTGVPGGDLLEGLSAGNSGGFSHLRANALVAPGLRTWEPSAFFQDDWRAKRWLTLNLGVRYDIFTPYTEKRGRISNYNQATGLIVSPSFPGSQQSGPTAAANTDYKDIAPRIGFAATLPHDTVLRGGFGLSFFPTNYGSNYALKNSPFNYTLDCNTQTASNSNTPCPAPFGNTVVANYGPPTSSQTSQVGKSGGIALSAGLPIPTLNVAQVFAPAACTVYTQAACTQPLTPSNPAGNPYAGSSTNAVPQHFPAAYLEQFSLQLQKQYKANVITVGYVGEMGRHIFRTLNLNNVTNAAQSGVTPLSAQFPWLTKASIAENADAATSAYNALQLGFVRRFNAGLTVSVNYVWSHGMDNSGGACQPTPLIPSGYCQYDNEAGTAPVQITSFSQSNAWGNSGLDTPNRIAGSINYQLPFGKMMTGAEGMILKGWTVNAAGSWQSGLPFGVTESGVGALGIGSGTPDQVCSGKLSNPSKLQWFNPACFKTPSQSNTYGNVHPNQLFGPHQRNLDFSVFKEFPVTEQFRLQFRTEVFNLTNTPNFNTPNGSVSFGACAPSVLTTRCTGVNSFPTGSISALNSNQSARQIQFALKLLF